MRLTFSKKLTHLNWPFPRGFTTGKATPEKYTTLLHVWVKYVNDTYPTIGFLQSMRVETELSSEGEEPEVFDCGAPVPAGPSPGTAGEAQGSSGSKPSSSGSSGFKVGDRVALRKRSSWPCPLEGNPTHRKDILPTYELKVKAVVGESQYLIECIMSTGQGLRNINHMVDASNLQIFSEQLAVDALREEKDAATKRAEAETTDEKKKASLVPKGHLWLFSDLDRRPDMQDQHATKCEVVPWSTILNEGNKNDSMADFQGEAAFLMCLLKDMAPPLTEKDLCVVHRQDPRKHAHPDGTYVVEVWTTREFKPLELVLTPYTHEVKDRYWTKGRSNMLRTSNVPFLKGKTMALDGRWRGDFQHASTESPEKHEKRRLGSLFFCVERTSSRSECNLMVKFTSVSLQAEVQLPGHKKPTKREVPRSCEIPVLTNPKALPQHTRLLVLEDMDLLKVQHLDQKQVAAKVAAEATGKRPRKE